MIDTQQYFDDLIQLLNLEKDEEEKQFYQLMANTSVSHRVDLGICWHPLKIVESGFGFGDYPFVIFERTRAKELSHQFSSGKPVTVFSTESNAPDSIKGVIQFVNSDQIKLVFFLNDEPEILSWGKLGVVLMPDEIAFKEQLAVLKLVSNAKNCRLADLRDVLLLNKVGEISDDSDFSETEQLNETQNKAIEHALKNDDAFLIHGPPGTGKTTTTIELTNQLAKQGNKILLTAPSNAAADLLALKSLEKGLHVIRIGNIARIDETLEEITIEGALRNHNDYAEIKKFRKQAAELRRMAGRYKRQFGKAEREQRKLILQEAKNMGKEARQIEEYILESIILKADVITSTLMGANNRFIKNIEFDTIIIDEAAQSPEPACWVPISKARKVIFAGDPFQLPPTVKSEEAAQKGLSTTLMEKLLYKIPTQLLEHQYRMNAKIMEFSNRWFYEGKLKAHPDIEHWGIPNEPSLEFIDTAGAGWEEVVMPESKSAHSPKEADFLTKRVLNFSVKNKEQTISIGVISPYKQQIEYLKNALGSYTFVENHKIDIKTIDSFQGQERDVVFISLVRSNDENRIGFLKDYRRMNVAMTRARKKLVVIGDSVTLAKDDFYRAFIDFCDKENGYKSVWEFDEFAENT
jgi:superfamily I DNA and/or RNA helicase